MTYIKIYAAIYVMLVCVVYPSAVECAESFEVRVVYFQPTNAPDAPIDIIKASVTKAQDQYGTEVEQTSY